MTTLAETLKTLSTPELQKLDALLSHADANSNCTFDELLEQVTANNAPPPLTGADNELVGARTYMLEIYDNLSPADAKAQALEEFAAGNLTPEVIRGPRLKHNVPRYRGRSAAGPLVVPPEPPNNVPATSLEPSAEPLPDNVVVLPTKLNLDNFHAKLFHNPKDDYEVW